MKKIIVSSCSGCPYYKTNRYGYCSKQYESDVEAYRAGVYAESSSELSWIFKHCPLPDEKE